MRWSTHGSGTRRDVAEPIKEVTGFQSLMGGAGVQQALDAEEAMRHAAAGEDLVVAEVAEPSELGFWKLAVIRLLHRGNSPVSLGVIMLVVLVAVLVTLCLGVRYRSHVQ